MTGKRALRSWRWAPVLAALFGIAALAVLTGCTVETQAELKTYSGINAIRQKHGLAPLTVDPGLIELARIRSRDMAAKSYFSHSPPDGCNFVCLMDSHGVPHSYSGENIAWNTWTWAETGQVAVDMWENSPPHLANILNCHFERFGTGVAKAPDGKVYFTMLFEGAVEC